jgi:hypothetical protein
MPLERVAHALGLQLEVRFQDAQNTPKPRAPQTALKVVFAAPALAAVPSQNFRTYYQRLRGRGMSGSVAIGHLAGVG